MPDFQTEIDRWEIPPDVQKKMAYWVVDTSKGPELAVYAIRSKDGSILASGHSPLECLQLLGWEPKLRKEESGA